MPTIHVSDKVLDKINQQQKGDEPPTDTLERMIDRDMEEIEKVVESKIYELVVDEALM